MKRTLKRVALSALFSFCIVGLTCADEAPEKDPEVLEVNKQTQKLEVRHSMLGYRDTLLFYTFKEQKTVLKLQIDNRDKTFPMTATIYVFEDCVTEDGLKKWLNNQHSDGLFPEVPNPVSIQKVPEKVCKVTSQKLLDNTKERFGEYANYAVNFKVKDFEGKDKGKGNASIKLKGFTGETKVHVKTK